MSLGEKLYRWSMEVGFDRKTAGNFFRVLGEYMESGEAPKWWIERCKRLEILNEEGKLELDEEFPGLQLILLGLVWEGVVTQKVADRSFRVLKRWANE